MKTRVYFKKAIKQTQEKLDDFLFKCTHRLSSKHFSRESKMGFKETVLFMMNMITKSVQIELNSFFNSILKENFSVSKQAYSKARQKINPEIFVELTDTLVKGFYECDDCKTWYNYRLLAVDGTILEIPNTALLRQEFGTVKNGSGEVARARAVCFYDVQNKLIIKSKIERVDVSERKIAKHLISQLINEGTQKDLILFDRGYPSAELISLLSDNNLSYLMRCQKNFCKEIKNAKKADQIVQIKYDHKSYDVRVLRFTLESGEEEILITNLLDKKLTIKYFKSLYFMRWGIEVKYNDLKNKLQIENFTGATKISIEQDFYAIIYLSNMVELAKIQIEETIKERTNGKGLKYEYKANINLLIGTLKDNFIMMLLEKSSRRRNKMYTEIMDQVAKSSVPIRPNRKYPRKKFLVNTKNTLSKKRCL